MAQSAQAIAEQFHVELANFKPSYNVAPGRSVPAVRFVPGTAQRELVLLHWGLIPSWSKHPSTGEKMIFVRAETVQTKPAYREAFLGCRCLIPADGFYEWQREHGRKQPYFVRLRTGHVFAFGGLWDRCEGSHGTTIESCAVLTTEANELIRPMHDRMPVLLAPEHYEEWLNPTN